MVIYMETTTILIIVDIYGDVIINGDYKWWLYMVIINYLYGN